MVATIRTESGYMCPTRMSSNDKHVRLQLRVKWNNLWYTKDEHQGEIILDCLCIKSEWMGCLMQKFGQLQEKVGEDTYKFQRYEKNPQVIRGQSGKMEYIVEILNPSQLK